MKTKLLAAIILLEIGSIIFLFWLIKAKRGAGISANILTPNSRPTKNQKLTYFREPEANSTDTGSWDNQKVSNHINSDSLNDPEIDLSGKRINIIALGDSFTYGQFVNRKDNWVSKLENKLQYSLDKQIQAINLGVKGYDIQYAVERYRIRGPKYNPHLVIWFLKGDDFNSVAEILTPLIEEEKKKYFNAHPDADKRYIFNKGEIGPPYIVTAVNKMMEMFGSEKALLEYQRKQIRELRKYYQGELLIVHFDLNRPYEALLSEVQRSDKRMHVYNLKYIYGDSKNYFPDEHPTPVGHDIIANDIYEYIMNNKDLAGLLKTPAK